MPGGSGEVAVGFALAVVSALAWAGLDATRKVLVREVDSVALLVLLTVGQLPLFAGWAATSELTVVWAKYWLPGLGSLVLNVSAGLLFFRAVRLSPLSLTVPLLAFVPVFTTFAAWASLGEFPNAIELVGIAVVVAGALVLHAGGARSSSPIAMVRALLRERGSLPMIGTALCWSWTIVCDKLATAHASHALHAVMLSAGVTLSGLLVLTMRGSLGQLRVVRRVWKPLVLATLLGAAGLGFQLVAIGSMVVSLVEATKRAIGVTMSVLLGAVLFEERIYASKVAAVALMCVGAALFASGG